MAFDDGSDSGLPDLMALMRTPAPRAANAFGVEVATLVWQGWDKEDISKQLAIAVVDLERLYERELRDGKKIIEGRVCTELVKRALSGDDKSLHLLAKSKFGFNEPREAAVQIDMRGMTELPANGENILVDAVRILGGEEGAGKQVSGEKKKERPIPKKAAKKVLGELASGDGRELASGDGRELASGSASEGMLAVNDMMAQVVKSDNRF